MKYDFKLVAGALYLYLLTLATGVVAANPYEAIVGRNVFGLKPPALIAPPPAVPVAAATTIKLRGISTILDRRQVLLKVMTAARPPEPAKEKSYLMSEGQGEDDIEVLEIDAVAGVVKLKNHDAPLLLTMKDDAEKPVVGAALPGPAVPPPQIPGQPAPAKPGLPVPATGTGVSVPTTDGGGSGRTIPIPTRSLRTSAADGAGSSIGATAGATAASFPTQPSVASERTLEENLAMYEINRAKNEQLRKAGVKIPPMPPHPLLRNAPAQGAQSSQ